jgi:acyl-CoA synthetase (AMP-forming)/AMP-acid ligase II
MSSPAQVLMHHVLERSVDRDPGRIAVVDALASRSYADVFQDAARIAQVLVAFGVKRGDRVVLALENSPRWAAAFFGVLQAGGVVVPLAPGPKNDRLRFALRDCTPAACLLNEATAGALDLAATATCAILIDRPGSDSPIPAPGEGRLDADSRTSIGIRPSGDERTYDLQGLLRQAPALAPRVRAIDIDLAAIIYTSGSTGDPRGVMLSHLNLASNAQSIVQYLGLRASDRMIVVLPFHYVYGLSLLTTHMMVGASLAIGPRLAFPNAILQSMQNFEVTSLAGVPSTFALLLHRSSIAQMEFPLLRYVTQAGGPMPPALLQQWLSLLPGVPFFVMYGATEASARLAYLEPSELPARIGSIGKAIPNVELAVLKDGGQPAAPGEVGEIVARGSNIMMGYWNCPDETAAAIGPHGYRTGDLATSDTEGFLYLVGRRQDMLKVGGERVGAKEIEDVLHEHAAVHEAAVVGAPHELFGEVPVAFVALCTDLSATSEDIISFCRARLPDHKVPARVVFQADLPKSTAGKIDKPALRALARTVEPPETAQKP